MPHINIQAKNLINWRFFYVYPWSQAYLGGRLDTLNIAIAAQSRAASWEETWAWPLHSEFDIRCAKCRTDSGIVIIVIIVIIVKQFGEGAGKFPGASIYSFSHRWDLLRSFEMVGTATCDDINEASSAENSIGTQRQRLSSSHLQSDQIRISVLSESDILELL